MDLTARKLAMSVALALLAAPSASAQLMDAVPHASYYIAVEEYYSGAYRQAERDIRREHGVRIGQTNWIDAICYHAMLGEVLYHQGRNAEALAEFDQACQVLLAYPNWLLQVKFQSTIGAGLRPDPNRSRRVPPWGQSSRTFVIGQFADTEQVLVGDLDAGRIAATGRRRAQRRCIWRVNVVEVMRTTALAIRRRNELLGPLAPTRSDFEGAIRRYYRRGNLAPANHWSGAWIDLLRGLAQAGMGKLDEADMLLGRSLVVDGQFDHPLTCVALLEQGRMAMVKGDTSRAAQMFAEAGFSAYYFEDWDVLTESVLAAGSTTWRPARAGVYPPLEPVAAWAQANRLQHVATKLRLAQAESLLWLGQVGGRRGACRRGAAGASARCATVCPAFIMLYLQAVVQLLQGKLEPGGEALDAALAAQASVSLRNFQILPHEPNVRHAAWLRRALAVDVLRVAAGRSVAGRLGSQAARCDGRAANVGMTRRSIAGFSRRWNGRMRRSRWKSPSGRSGGDILATRPLGGRLLALRAILESPVTRACRKRHCSSGSNSWRVFPHIKRWSTPGQKIRDQLLAGPVLADRSGRDEDARRTVRRMGTKCRSTGNMFWCNSPCADCRRPASFRRWRTTAELQQSLGKGEALVVFHSAAGNCMASW